MKSIATWALLALVAFIAAFCWFLRPPKWPILTDAELGQLPAAATDLYSTGKHGNDVAMYQLGLILESAHKDSAAAKCFQVAANGKRKLADAQYHLGMMYAEGRGVPKSDAQAFTLLLAAVNNCHIEALDGLKNNSLYRSRANLNKVDTMWHPFMKE